ncbi:MAG: hypothetical protein ACN6OP_07035 [Pseudomonadales bacterium]
MLKKNYKSGGKFTSYVSMAERLTALRHGTGAVAQGCLACPLQNERKDLDRAYKGVSAKQAAFPPVMRRSMLYGRDPSSSPVK